MAIVSSSYTIDPVTTTVNRVIETHIDSDGGVHTESYFDEGKSTASFDAALAARAVAIAERLAAAEFEKVVDNA